MSTLRNHLANSAKNAAGQRINPEIDAKIDKFIAANQGLYDHYMKQEKIVLVRKLILPKMRRAEFWAMKDERMQRAIDASPELIAKFNTKMARIPEEKQATAFRSVAQSVLADHAAAEPRNGVRISA